MSDPTANTWRFSSTFWVANLIELFERAAYYGIFIALAVFLTSVAGFTDVQAGWVGASFAGLIYLLPFVTGAISDRIGFRPALVIAFALLERGVARAGLQPVLHDRQHRLLHREERGGAGSQGSRRRCGPASYAHAHVIWWVFASVGVTAFVALLILQRSLRRATPTPR